MEFELANKSARTTRSGVLKFYVRSMTIFNSAFLTSCIFIGWLKEKPSESCLKGVKKLSKINQTSSSGNGTVRSTVYNNILISVLCIPVRQRFKSSTGNEPEGTVSSMCP